MTLGERIKNYRQKAGLSQEQLAEKINVSRQAITKWENDISDIKRSAINQRNILTIKSQYVELLKVQF